MAIEGPPAIINNDLVSRSEIHMQIFYLALGFIVVGVGFLKSSISTLVGDLYEIEIQEETLLGLQFFIWELEDRGFWTLLCAFCR